MRVAGRQQRRSHYVAVGMSAARKRATNKIESTIPQPHANSLIKGTAVINTQIECLLARNVKAQGAEGSVEH